jgi:hypothetical protein
MFCLCHDKQSRNLFFGRGIWDTKLCSALARLRSLEAIADLIIVKRLGCSALSGVPPLPLRLHRGCRYMFAVQEDRFLEWFAQGALAYRNLGKVVCAYHP